MSALVDYYGLDILLMIIVTPALLIWVAHWQCKIMGAILVAMFGSEVFEKWWAKSCKDGMNWSHKAMWGWSIVGAAVMILFLFLVE